MSICLGKLTCFGSQTDKDIEVWCSNYDDDEVWLLIERENIEVEVTLDQRQMQELSVIIDRFLS